MITKLTHEASGTCWKLLHPLYGSQIIFQINVELSSSLYTENTFISFCSIHMAWILQEPGKLLATFVSQHALYMTDLHLWRHRLLEDTKFQYHSPTKSILLSIIVCHIFP